MYVVQEGSAGIGLGRMISTWLTADDISYTGGNYQGFTDYQMYGIRRFDLIYHNFLEHLGVFTDTVFQIGDTFEPHVLRYMKPQNLPYSSITDFQRYGSVLGRIPVALAALRHPGQKSLEGENIVRHITASGSAIVPGGLQYGTEYDEDHYGFNRTVWNMDGAPNTFYTDRSPKTYSSGNQYFLPNTEEYLGDVKGFLSSNPTYSPDVNPDGRQSNKGVKYFNYSVTASTITISYCQTIELGWSGGDTTSDFATTIVISRRDFVDQGDVLNIAYWTIHDIIRLVSIVPQGGNNQQQANDANVWGEDGTRSTAKGLPAMMSTVNLSFSDDELYDTVVKELRHQIEPIELLHGELKKAAYVSVGDALSSYQNVIENNYFESLSDLRDVMSLVPDLGPVNRMLRAVGVGNIITGALSFVDVLTNAYLLYQFGLKPMADDLRSLAEGLDRIVYDLSHRSENVDLRGKFTFTAFPEDDPLSGCTLVVRSKVRLRIPKTSALAMILSFKNAGFDLSPSSGWDLIPFSFVIDWFAQIGDRMELGFNHLRFLSMELTSCVHSYTVYKDLVDTESIDFSDGAQIKHYFRDTSVYLPAPRNGRYDFLSGNSGPPVATAGSLLWTVLRS